MKKTTFKSIISNQRMGIRPFSPEHSALVEGFCGQHFVAHHPLIGELDCASVKMYMVSCKSPIWCEVKDFTLLFVSKRRALAYAERLRSFLGKGYDVVLQYSFWSIGLGGLYRVQSTKREYSYFFYGEEIEGVETIELYPLDRVFACSGQALPRTSENLNWLFSDAYEDSSWLFHRLSSNKGGDALE